jgi:hypothetical protein
MGSNPGSGCEIQLQSNRFFFITWRLMNPPKIKVSRCDALCKFLRVFLQTLITKKS